ncbi:MAG TPA: arylamine N-acetyltransferase [Ktedonosporobacter sp.]|nr:arylamine N-acetyltransferase [Ktedonosporobacter sp.]
MDIYDYLERIGYRGSLEPTLQTLQGLHEAHLQTVPFENLSIYYKQPIVLGEEALYDKIVRRRRGGFCFELNGLFAVLLCELGFEVTQVAASMAHDDGQFGPEVDHLTLLVHLAEDWLADVGNGDSFRLPLRVEEGVEYREGDPPQQSYRMERDGEHWIVQRCGSDGIWKPEYRFGVQPHKLADFRERCHYYETSPDSHFTHGRMCSLATPEGRITVRDLRLITTVHGQKEERILGSEEECREVLRERFGVVV